MTDEHPDPGESATDGPSPEEWIDRLAESQGRSRSEVLEELISSHWTLQEMLRLVEQSEEGLEDEGNGDEQSGAELDILGFRSDIEQDIARLEDHVESLDEAVAADDAGTDVSALREDIGSLAKRVNALERSVEQGQGPSAADLQALDERFSRVAESLAGRHEDLRSRVDDEFSNLETILAYLIDITDTLDDRTASLSTEYHDEVDELLAERRALVDLKRDAARLGVDTAKCEYCSTTVDIAMLPTAECPQCDRRFEDVVTPSGWLPFGSNTLTVAGKSPSDDERPE